MRAINVVCQWTMLMRTAKRARGLGERQMQLHARWKNRWKGEAWRDRQPGAFKLSKS